MKQLLSLLLIFTGLNAWSQTAVITSPDPVVCAGQSVTISGSTSSSGGSPIVNYIWSITGPNSFNGNTGPGVDFVQVFNTPGTYSVGLVVQFQNGTSAATQSPNFITINPNPSAAIGASVLSCDLPFSVSYNIAGSTPGVNYAWTFQSGTPASSTSANILVDYPAAGSYDVSLLVSNPNTGCTATATQTVNISNFQTDFTVPATICVGTSVPLLDNSTIGVNSWTWSATPGIGVAGTANFNSTNTQNPLVVFTTPGQYTIDLASSNTTVPCNGTHQIIVNVLASPVPSYTAVDSVGCSPLPSVFTNHSQNPGGATFSWNFGDGTPVFNGFAPPVHVYTGINIADTFYPVLTMIGANTCTASYKDTIFLNTLIAGFTVDDRNGCEFDPFQFTDVTQFPLPPTSWQWTFGDGTTSNLQNPTHNNVYTCGEYDVRLIVSRGICRDTATLSKGSVPFGAPDRWGIPSGYKAVSDQYGSGATGQLIQIGTHTTPNFRLDHNVDCIKKEFKLTDLTTINCPHDTINDVDRIWVFNKIPESINTFSGDSIYKKQFSDTMQNLGPNQLPGTDIDLYVDFRGCLDSIFTFDSIYIMAPVSKFKMPTLLCDPAQGTGIHSIFVDDTQSIYSHSWLNPTTVLGRLIPTIGTDDIVVTFKWGDGTANFVEETDVFLDDVNDHATNSDPANPTITPTTAAVPLTHTFPGYGDYTVRQVIQNRTTGCFDSTDVLIHISWLTTDFVFDEAGPDDDRDSLCVGQAFNMIQTSATHAGHQPKSYSFDMFYSLPTVPSVTPYIITGTDPQTSFNSAFLGYANPYPSGNHNIELTTTNSVGCSFKAQAILSVFDPPVANFIFDDTSGCIGVASTVTVNNNSSHPAGSLGNSGAQNANWGTNGFSWTVNGVTSTTNGFNNPMFTFVASPVANTALTLTVTDALGCVSAPYSFEHIVRQPTADINVVSTICNYDVLNGQMSSVGNGNLVGFIWKLDGVSDPLSAASVRAFPASWHINNNTVTSETHQVELIVIDTDGCTDTLHNPARTITVTNPQAAFTSVKVGASQAADGSFNCPPVLVDFTNTSASSGSPIVDFAWQFGIYGDPNNVTNTNQSSPHGIQYIYADTYDLRMIIRDAAGCIDSLFIDDYLIINGPSGTPDIFASQGICGQDFNFDLDSTHNVTNWYWDLGDGTIINSADEADNNFDHNYSAVQTYYPVLHVQDASGCDVPYRDTIDIQPNGVTALFTAAPEYINLGSTVTFDDQSFTVPGANLISWIWNFGDGRIDTLNNGNDVTNEYFIGGEVPVLLTAIDDRGCKDQYLVILDIKIDFWIPNVFSGIGSNGPNEFFTLFADVFKDFNILIVNRWGNVVHEGTRDVTNPRLLWDGIDEKSGKLCNEGTYFYKLEGILKDDQPVKVHGFVTLIGTVAK